MNGFTLKSLLLISSLTIIILPVAEIISTPELTPISTASGEIENFVAEQIDLDDNDLFDYLELTFNIQSSEPGNLSIEYQFFDENQKLFQVYVTSERELIPITEGVNSVTANLSSSDMYGLSYSGDLTVNFNARINIADNLKEILTPVTFELIFNYLQYELPPLLVSSPLDVALVNLDQNNTLADIINLEIPVTSTINAIVEITAFRYRRFGDELKNRQASHETFNVTSQTKTLTVPFLAHGFFSHEYFDFSANLKISSQGFGEYQIINQLLQNVSLPDELLEPFGLVLIPNSEKVVELDRDKNGRIDQLGIKYTVNTTKHLTIDYIFNINSASGQIYGGKSVESVSVDPSVLGEITIFMNIDGFATLNSTEGAEISIGWSATYDNYSKLAYHFGTTLFFTPSDIEYESPPTSIIMESIRLSYIEPSKSEIPSYAGIAVDFDVDSKYLYPELQVTISLYGEQLSIESIYTWYQLSWSRFIYGDQYGASQVYHERIELTNELLAIFSPSPLEYEGVMQIKIESSIWLVDETSLFYKLEDYIVLIEFSLALPTDGMNTGTIPTFTGSSEMVTSIPIDLFTGTNITYSEFSSSSGRSIDLNIFWLGVGLSALYVNKKTRTPKC